MSTPSSIVGEQNKQRQVRRPKTFFPLLSVRCRDLRRVLARFENRLQIDEAAVTLDEVVVDLRRNLSRIEKSRPVHRPLLAGPGDPAQGVRIDLVARHVAAAHLLDNPVALEGEEQKRDRGVDLGATERVTRRHVLAKSPSQIAPVAAVG